MKTKLLKMSVSVGIFAVICCIIGTFTKLGECSSSSLQGIRYVLFLKSSAFTYGDIVFIRNHVAKYVDKLSLAKRVLGLPGDKVRRQKGTLLVGPYKLPLLASTSEGKPLTPLQVDTIPQGYVFVAGDHSRSLDSRYEEFDLVPVEEVWGKGVWAW
jgi:signal peptidase I